MTDNAQHTSKTRALHVFLCHSSGDKPTVRELYRRSAPKVLTLGWMRKSCCPDRTGNGKSPRPCVPLTW